MRTFTEACAIASLLYLFVFSCFEATHETHTYDYAQFQVAGSVGLAGEWSSLYATPVTGAIYNAGYTLASIEKPRAIALGAEHGIRTITSHFMQAPPVALLLLPLGWFGIASVGYSMWIILSALALWFCALAAARICEQCAGRRSYWSGILMLAVAFCPVSARAVIVANVSTFIAAAIGWTIVSFHPDRQSPMAAAATTVFASMVKYAGLLFVPIALRLRAWRMLGWSALLTAAWIAIALAVMGPVPFRDYLFSIVPTLGRPHEYSDNVSLAGVLLRVMHQQPPLPQWIALPMDAVEGICLLVILGLLWLQGRTMPFQSIVAATTALLSWLLIFSPITWTHYLIYLYPVWGWLIWTAKRSMLHACLVVAAIGTIVIGLPTEPPTQFDPLGFRFLISLSITMALGIDSLCRSADWGVFRSFFNATNKGISTESSDPV